jgi:chromosomal replication initiator protein
MTPYIYAGLPTQTRDRVLKVVKTQEDVNIPKSIKQEDIIYSVCKYFNVKESDLISKSRKRKFVLARQICMQMIYTLVEKSTLKKIGKHFDRDHSTCVYANQTVQDLFDTDKKYKEDYKNILRSI